MRKIILSLIVILGAIGVLRAQQPETRQLADTLSTKIYFPINRPELYLDFQGNKESLTHFVEQLKKLWESDAVHGIKIIAAASPDGPEAFNSELSQDRAASIRTYIRRRIDIPEDLFVISSLGADWEGLVEMVKASDIAHKDELLAILENPVTTARIPAIRRLAGGTVWKQLKSDFLPKLRVGHSVVIEVFVDKVRDMKPEPVVAPQPEPQPEQQAAAEEVITPDPCKPFYMNLRTNLLYDLALLPNIGAEFYLGKGFSIVGNYQGAWWSVDSKHLFWRMYGGDLEVRRYFGKAAERKPLTGHHLGIYGQVGTFDFELGKKGILCHLIYGGGLAYGYSLPVAKRLNIDFTVGFGYLHGDYDIYHPNFPKGSKDGCYEWLETRTANWILPTKVGITLVWQIGCDNVNRKKGGSK